MKGLLALGVHMNKAFIIGAAITSLAAALLTGACHLFLAEDEMYPVLMPFMVLILLIIISVVAYEGLARAIEKNIKNRFLNYALSGVTVTNFNLSELLKNILFGGYSFALGTIYLLIIKAFGFEVTEIYFRVLVCVVLIAGLTSWILVPLTLLLKSQEKASAVFALPFGFAGGVCAALCETNETGIVFDLEEFIMNNTNFMIMIAVSAVIYFIVTVVQHFILKRGGLC